MSFVLKKQTSFKWPVTFSMPGDGGIQEENSFDAEFKQLARSVYVTNDRRSELKKEINILTKSGLVEEKSYKEYK